MLVQVMLGKFRYFWLCQDRAIRPGEVRLPQVISGNIRLSQVMSV